LNTANAIEGGACAYVKWIKYLAWFPSLPDIVTHVPSIPVGSATATAKDFEVNELPNRH
jgi:hypothetical protein